MKKLILLFVIINLKVLAQSVENETLHYLPISSYSIINNISSFKYSISSSDHFVYQMNTNSTSTLHLNSDEDVSNKSPWLAFGLSLLYPGLGQLYNAEYGKALLIGGLGTIGLGLAMLAAMSTDYDSESNPDYIAVMVYTGVAIWGGAYIWSLIDAPISASNINERNRKIGITIFSTEDEKFAVRLRNGNKLNNYSLGFSVSF